MLERLQEDAERIMGTNFDERSKRQKNAKK